MSFSISTSDKCSSQYAHVHTNSSMRKGLPLLAENLHSFFRALFAIIQTRSPR